MGFMLIYMCEKCSSPNFIPEYLEGHLQHVHGVVCAYCSHTEENIKDLKNYSKATRSYENE